MKVTKKLTLLEAFNITIWGNWPLMSIAKRTLELKEEGKSITTIIGTEGEGIFISSTLEDLSERLEVQTQSHGSVASVHLKSVLRDQEGDQSNVSGVQSLHSNTSSGALKVHLYTNSNNK